MKQILFYQKKEIEQAHLEEFEQFNLFWDAKIKEFDEEAEKIKV